MSEGETPARAGAAGAAPSPPPDFLDAGSLGALIAEQDWSATPLGPIADWPPSRRAIIATMLRAPSPQALLWGEAGTLLYNDAYAALVGSRHPALLGMPIRAAWPEITAFNDRVMRKVLAGETLSYKDQELLLDRNGQLEPAFFDLHYSPLTDEAGAPVGVLALVTETTARVAAERGRTRAEADLARSETHWRGLFEELQEGFVLGELVRDEAGKGVDWTYLEVNPAFGRLVDRIPEAVIGRSVRGVFPGIEEFWIDHMASVVESGQSSTFLDRVGTIDRWFDGHAFPLGGDRFGVMFIEVTDRVTSEQHQSMLMAELDHRVKNILAVVGSIASLSSGGKEGSGRAEEFIGRIEALAQSHSLLARSRWKGAGLRDLVETALAPYRTVRSDRLAVRGDDLEVTPKAAQTLALALHELVSNAAKYGALSQESGRLSVDWHLAGEGEEGRLLFVWQERGGPPVEQPPPHRGFGSFLIETTLAHDLGGDVSVDFAREGVRVALALPLGTLMSRNRFLPPEPRRTDRLSRGEEGSLAGRTILVVEDEHLIGWQTAASLEAAGCAVKGPIGRLSDALKAAVAEDWDAAVLDINLHGEFVWPVARALQARRIPVLFTTGYSAVLDLPPELAGLPLLEKPVREERLLAALTALFAPAGLS